MLHTNKPNLTEEQTEDQFKQNFKTLGEIAEANNFISIWSIDKVGPEDMDKPFSTDFVTSFTYITYADDEEEQEEGEDQKSHFIGFDDEGKKLTWLEAWKYADQLIRQSGDIYHIYIEQFKPTYMGNYNLITGS